MLRPAETNKMLIISGAPASGKGTQCKFLVEKFNVKHISTGERQRSSPTPRSSSEVAGATRLLHSARNLQLSQATPCARKLKRKPRSATRRRAS